MCGSKLTERERHECIIDWFRIFGEKCVREERREEGEKYGLYTRDPPAIVVASINFEQRHGATSSLL